MPALAAELVDSIISFLHPIPLQRVHGIQNYLDKPAATHVAKCALVCRDWVPSSRRVLFYRVHVRQNTAYGFAKLFNRPQRLTFPSFIRELELRDGIAEHRWMKTVFPKIAKHLPSSIHTVLLTARYGSSPLQSLAIPSLRGITQFGLVGQWKLKLADTLECIASFPALEGLKLWLAHDWEDRTLPEPIPRPADTLMSLNFRILCPEPLFEWIQESSVIISELHLYFPFAMQRAPIESTSQYIRSLGPSLTSLALTFDIWNTTSPMAGMFTCY
jgi:uncharacterized protein (DUF1810 family)